MGCTAPVSRPKPRGAAIAGRLSEVLQDDLADIASTMDWIDAAPAPLPVVPQAAAVSPSGVASDPPPDPALDLMLDDFAFAVDAMFSSRDRVLTTGGDAPEGEPRSQPDREPDDVDRGDTGGGERNDGNDPQMVDAPRQS